MTSPSPGWTQGFRALVVPVDAARGVVADPAPWRTLLALALSWTALGLGTLPRQTALLSKAFAPATDQALAAGREALASGLVRLMVMDRLVPVPAVLVGAVLLVVAAEPVLMLSRDRRPALVAVAVLGLAPLVVGRLGELAFTWMVDGSQFASPGAALNLPHRFATGARLFWVGSVTPPAWVELLETRVNLVTLWCAALWAVGLAHLDAGKLEAWHVVLALGCLGVAGVATWVVGPIVVPMVLRGLG
jgi:hypothetical protein